MGACPECGLLLDDDAEFCATCGWRRGERNEAVPAQAAVGILNQPFAEAVVRQSEQARVQRQPRAETYTSSSTSRTTRSYLMLRRAPYIFLGAAVICLAPSHGHPTLAMLVLGAFFALAAFVSLLLAVWVTHGNVAEYLGDPPPSDPQLPSTSRFQRSSGAPLGRLRTSERVLIGCILVVVVVVQIVQILRWH